MCVIGEKNLVHAASSCVIDLPNRAGPKRACPCIVASDSLDQCEQCRRRLVLFGLERDQRRFVCGVCAAMRTGLPDPGHSSRFGCHTWAQTGSLNLSLEQIPLPRYGGGEKSPQILVSVFGP